MLYKDNNIYRVKKNDNNSNILKKYLIMGNEKKNRRYRLNCTYFDEKKNLFWYGKMIKVTPESIIF